MMDSEILVHWSCIKNRAFLVLLACLLLLGNIQEKPGFSIVEDGVEEVFSRLEQNRLDMKKSNVHRSIKIAPSFSLLNIRQLYVKNRYMRIDYSHLNPLVALGFKGEVHLVECSPLHLLILTGAGVGSVRQTLPTQDRFALQLNDSFNIRVLTAASGVNIQTNELFESGFFVSAYLGLGLVLIHQDGLLDGSTLSWQQEHLSAGMGLKTMILDSVYSQLFVKYHNSIGIKGKAFVAQSLEGAFWIEI